MSKGPYPGTYFPTAPVENSRHSWVDRQKRGGSSHLSAKTPTAVGPSRRFRSVLSFSLTTHYSVSRASTVSYYWSYFQKPRRVDCNKKIWGLVYFLTPTFLLESHTVEITQKHNSTDEPFQSRTVNLRNFSHTSKGHIKPLIFLAIRHRVCVCVCVCPQ